MRETTKRQKEILDFIAKYVQNHAYPPTVRELADHFKISGKGAHDHILALKKKGLIKFDDKKSRTMELIADDKKPTTAEPEQEKETDIRQIPLLGTVAAGKPILAEENRDGSVEIPISMLRVNLKYFALKIRGDSMEGAGIMDGDTAVIESRNTIKNGEIAVVMLEDEGVTLKTFYLENSRIRLQPANPKYQPIYCSRELRVLGRLAFILRSYNYRG